MERYRYPELKGKALLFLLFFLVHLVCELESEERILAYLAAD
jgi:hypothetical protein